METTLAKNRIFILSDRTRGIIIDVIVYLYVGLFVYTAGSKLIGFEKFQKVLSRSPLIGDMSNFLSWAIPTVEIVLSLLLIIPATRKTGLFGALVLMLSFTIYLIWMIVVGGENLPCSCGGVIAAMSWKEHIVFNTGMIGLALYGLGLIPKK